MSVQLIDWDLALIQKYNYSGPRYTSYPTALEFSPEFGAAEFDAAVARYPQRPLSLYVHIPFCRTPCFQGGFFMRTNQTQAHCIVSVFLFSALLREAISGEPSSTVKSSSASPPGGEKHSILLRPFSLAR